MTSHPIKVNLQPPINVDEISGYVTVYVHQDDAENLSYALSDLLCWVAGYKAGQADTEHHPMGVEAARTLNEALKRAINK